VPAARGKAVHATVTDTMRDKQSSGENPTPEKAGDLAATHLDRIWNSDGVTLQPEEVALGMRKVKANAKDFAVAVSRAHAVRLAPGIQPVATEHTVIAKPKGFDWELKGRIDLIDGANGKVIIRDTKTSEKAAQSDAAEKSDQLTIYALLHLADTKRMPDELVLDHIHRTPVKHIIDHTTLSSVRTVADVNVTLTKLNRAIEGVERGVFLPAAEGSWFCNARWCEYWSTCPYVRRPRLVQVVAPDLKEALKASLKESE
jgi:hypothetical protein